MAAKKKRAVSSRSEELEAAVLADPSSDAPRLDLLALGVIHDELGIELEWAPRAE